MARYALVLLIVFSALLSAMGQQPSPSGAELTLPLVPERAQELAVEHAVQPITETGQLPAESAAADEVHTIPHLRLKEGGPPILGVTIGSKSEAARIADERQRSNIVRPPLSAEEPLTVEFDRR